MKDENEAYWAVELDLEPFKSHFPMMTRPTSIGDGVRFLNRRVLNPKHAVKYCNVFITMSVAVV